MSKSTELLADCLQWIDSISIEDIDIDDCYDEESDSEGSEEMEGVLGPGGKGRIGVRESKAYDASNLSFNNEGIAVPAASSNQFCMFFWFWRFKDKICNERKRRMKQSQLKLAGSIRMRCFRIRKALKFWQLVSMGKQFARKIKPLLSNILRRYRVGILRWFYQKWKRRSRWPVVAKFRPNHQKKFCIVHWKRRVSVCSKQFNAQRISYLYRLFTQFALFRAQLNLRYKPILPSTAITQRLANNKICTKVFVRWKFHIGNQKLQYDQCRYADYHIVRKYLRRLKHWSCLHRFRARTVKCFSQRVLMRNAREYFIAINNQIRLKAIALCFRRIYPQLTAINRWKIHWKSKLTINNGKRLLHRYTENRIRGKLASCLLKLKSLISRKRRDSSIQHKIFKLSSSLSLLRRYFRKILLKAIASQQQNNIAREFLLLRNWKLFREKIIERITSRIALRRGRLRGDVRAISDCFRCWRIRAARRVDLRIRLHVFQARHPLPKCSDALFRMILLKRILFRWKSTFLLLQRNIRFYIRQILARKIITSKMYSFLRWKNLRDRLAVQLIQKRRILKRLHQIKSKKHARSRHIIRHISLATTQADPIHAAIYRHIISPLSSSELAVSALSYSHRFEDLFRNSSLMSKYMRRWLTVYSSYKQSVWEQRRRFIIAVRSSFARWKRYWSMVRAVQRLGRRALLLRPHFHLWTRHRVERSLSMFRQRATSGAINLFKGSSALGAREQVANDENVGFTDSLDLESAVLRYAPLVGVELKAKQLASLRSNNSSKDRVKQEQEQQSVMATPLRPIWGNKVLDHATEASSRSYSGIYTKKKKQMTEEAASSGTTNKRSIVKLKSNDH